MIKIFVKEKIAAATQEEFLIANFVGSCGATFSSIVFLASFLLTFDRDLGPPFNIACDFCSTFC